MARDAEMPAAGYAKSPLDWYVEPEWAADALIEAEAAIDGDDSWGERPSMPPGAHVKALGDKAFRHGKVDYMWVVWDVACPPEVTEWRTIGPRAKAVADV